MDTLSPFSQNPETQVSPAGVAFLALLAIEDSLGMDDAIIVQRPDTTVVLVGSIDAWEAWSLALCARRFMVEERLGDHMQVTQTLIGERPVMVLHGDLDETVPAMPMAVAA